MNQEKTDWSKFEIPVALMMLATVAIVVWHRLFYGVDLGAEASQILKVRDFIEGQGLFARAPGFDQIPAYWVAQVLPWVWTPGELFTGLALWLRRFEWSLLMGFALFMAFCLRKRAPIAWGWLFMLPVLAYMPNGNLGLNPLSWIMVIAVAVFFLIWKGLFSSRDFWTRALPVLAVLNLMFLFVFIYSWQQDPEVFREALGWQIISALRGAGATGWWDLVEIISKAGWSTPLFFLSLVLAFLLPSRFFHLLFVALVGLVSLLLPKATFLPGAAVGPSEVLILFMSPLVAAHLWRIRRSLSVSTRLKGSLFSILFAALLMGWVLGPVGACLALVLLFIFSFYSGAERKLKFPVLISAFSFSFCLIMGTYQQYPAGQSPRQSLDMIESGVWAGIWTTRPEARMLEEMRQDMAGLLPSAESFALKQEHLGAALLAPQDLVGLSENPDLILDLSDEDEVVTLSVPEGYQIIKEAARYRIYARRALVEEAMSKQ